MIIIFWGKGKNEQKAYISFTNEMEAKSEVFDDEDDWVYQFKKKRIFF